MSALVSIASVQEPSCDALFDSQQVGYSTGSYRESLMPLLAVLSRATVDCRVHCPWPSAAGKLEAAAAAPKLAAADGEGESAVAASAINGCAARHHKEIGR